jgi:hypothetical protein
MDFTPMVAVTPSAQVQERKRDLLDGNRNGTLTAKERAELDEFSRISHVMRMLKARAHHKLQDNKIH